MQLRQLSPIKDPDEYHYVFDNYHAFTQARTNTPEHTRLYKLHKHASITFTSLSSHHPNLVRWTRKWDVSNE